MFFSTQLSCEFKHVVSWDLEHRSCQRWYHSTPGLRTLGTAVLVQHRRDCPLTALPGSNSRLLLFYTPSPKRMKKVAFIFYPAAGGSTVSTGLRRCTISSGLGGPLSLLDSGVNCLYWTGVSTVSNGLGGPLSLLDWVGPLSLVDGGGGSTVCTGLGGPLSVMVWGGEL